MNAASPSTEEKVPHWKDCPGALRSLAGAAPAGLKPLMLQAADAIDRLREEQHETWGHVNRLETALGMCGKTTETVIDAAIARLAPEPPGMLGGIKWSNVRNPDANCSYTHVIGETPLGRILMTWKGWKVYFDATVDESPWGFMTTVGNNVEACKLEVEMEYNRRLRLALTKEGGA